MFIMFYRNAMCSRARRHFGVDHILPDVGTTGMLQRLRDWASTVRRDVVAVWLVARDPRVPWYVKLLAFAVAGYAVSPIDLIPDFVPILGYLDDAIIVPLGIMLVMKLVPEDIVAEHRASAVRAADLPGSKTAALVIICLWLVALTATTRFAYWYFGH